MATKVLDLELAADRLPAVVASEFADAMYLVRLRGVPVGWMHDDNGPGQPGDLRRRAVAQAGGDLWAEWLAQDLVARSESAAQPAELPQITAVVCTRDRAEGLERCLTALRRQRYPSYEILVVDNAPTDSRTREVATRFGVRYVVEPRPGLDWARNRGLAEASFPIVAYTDDDVEPDPGWLAGIAAGFRSPDVHAVLGLALTARLHSEPERAFETIYGGMAKGFRPALHRAHAGPMRYQASRFGVGCNMAFRRDHLLALGGFDPALDVGTATGGGGDLDMFQRVFEDGAALAYRPAALVRHHHRKSRSRLRRQLFDNGRGYSSTLWAAFRRARGRDRLRVVREYWLWMRWWLLRRPVRWAARRRELPPPLLLAELAGAPLGPLLYTWSSRRARRVGRAEAESR